MPPLPMVATPEQLTLAEYLARSDRREGHYELVNGELREMPPEADFNSQIASFLFAAFLTVTASRLIRCKSTEIVVPSAQATVRLPDLLILNDQLLLALRQTRRGTITLDMPPPALVVEVVSPGKANAERDYLDKRSEYAARGIAEYWIVDPEQAQVSILSLSAGEYADTQYRGDTPMRSPSFPSLELTAAQVLRAGET